MNLISRTGNHHSQPNLAFKGYWELANKRGNLDVGDGITVVGRSQLDVGVVTDPGKLVKDPWPHRDIYYNRFNPTTKSVEQEDTWCTILPDTQQVLFKWVEN